MDLAIGIFLILLGFAIKHFKLYFLIAGYNTMSAADKKKANIEKVAILLRNVLICIGGVNILSGLGHRYLEDPEIVNYLYFPLVLGSVVYLLFKSNSKAYKN